MSTSLRFDDQVVVITDASTAFGRSSAALFGVRGAKLVLNYPPGQQDAENAVITLDLASLRAREQVLATHEEPWNGEKIIAGSINKFGAVHVVIHNACPSKTSCSSGSIHDAVVWDSVRRSVIDGAFHVTKLNLCEREDGLLTIYSQLARSAWPDFRKNGFGRLIFVDSELTGLGTVGRFALLGFSQTLAREGAKYEIAVNVVSRNASLFVQGTNEKSSSNLDVNHFASSSASLAVVLAHKATVNTSGSIFELQDQRIARLHWERAKGIILNPDLNFTATSLAERWAGVSDFTEKTFPDSPMDFGRLLPQAQALPSNKPQELIRLDGSVAIVTGGASGLGRCYCLAFARLGASVVVNDLKDPQVVVNQIRSEGGRAVAAIASVEDATQIVNTALQTYGRVDFLVNNAGFVRDKSFLKMDETTWNSILQVHLDGTYNMTKAVWNHFLKQGQGSIVNTTSTSGIYGNFGQANYSAAKLAILGLSEACAREGFAHNIRVNTIAPVASTGGLAMALSDTNDKNKQLVFKPEYVVPIVMLLNSGSFRGSRNRITGGLFEVACGWHASTRLRPAAVYQLPGSSEPDAAELQGIPSNLNVDPEALFSVLTKSRTQTPGTASSTMAEVKNKILTNIEKHKLEDSEQTHYDITDKDIILYNLSVGARRSDLQLVYEKSPKFQPLPTFGMIPYFSQMVIDHHANLLPNFKPEQALLGEVYLEILQFPLPTSGRLSSTRRVIEVLDKGKAAVGITGYTTLNATTGRPVFYNELSFFMRGAGGFGGPRELPLNGPSSRVYIIPQGRPDAIDEYKTSEEQAAFYRLMGDRMAMHIDPSFSGRAGFSAPILHGMCFMGIAGRYIFQRYGAYRSIKVRFTGTVIPGQTLRTETWRVEKEKDLILFQMRVVETGKLCIAGGGAHLVDIANSLRTSRI